MKKTKKYNAGGEMYRKNAPPVDAIEPVYPLEEVLLGGPVGKALSKGIGTLASKAEMAMRPKVQNSVYAKIPGRQPTGKYAQRYIHSPEELQNIKDTGYMLPKPGGKAQKYFTAADEVTPAGQGASTIRVPRDKVPANRAVKRKDIEVYNTEKETWEPFKKGGTVKASRGDGCAKRGKTRGKFR